MREDPPMSDADGFVFAYRLDGRGGGAKLTWEQARQLPVEDGLLWLHLDYTDERAVSWLEKESGSDEVTFTAMTAEETRPRSLRVRDGLLVILRGVNLNAGAEADDMISVRVWVEQNKVITLRHQRIMAIEDVRTAIESDTGPTDAGEFLEELVDRMALRMGSVISDLDDSVDALENEMLTQQSFELRSKIADIRRTAVRIRRYLAPQKEAVAYLQNEKVSWLDDMDRLRLRELADRTTRYVEDLDSIRERASVTQEELNNRLAEQMNKTMYVLAIVSAVFLPLGLLTGLLGINVGGIPGTEIPWAFTAVCILLGLVASLEMLILRRMKLM